MTNTYTQGPKKKLVSTASEANLEIERAWRDRDEAAKPSPPIARRDRVGMMMGVVTAQPTQSAYKSNFVFEEEAKSDIQEKDYTHHYKKDFAKSYSEAVFKHKSVLR